MTKKKSKGSVGAPQDPNIGPEVRATADGSSSKSKQSSKPSPETNAPPTLVICRNKYMNSRSNRGQLPWIGLIDSSMLTSLQALALYLLLSWPLAEPPS